MAFETLETRTARFGVELTIAASAETVWAVLVDETAAWWPDDCHVLGEDSMVVLDAEAGGELLESHPEGESVVWYTVQLCRPGRTLQLVGPIAPPWGGPAMSMPTWTLEEDGEGHTRFRVTEHVVGHVTDKLLEDLEGGWKLLMEGLRAYVEQGD